MERAKYKLRKLTFNSANPKLFEFLDELKELAKDAFGIAAQAIIEQFIYDKMPPHLKSINQAHLENGMYEQIVTHLKWELELNGLEIPDKLQTSTVRQHAATTNADRQTNLPPQEKTGTFRKPVSLAGKTERSG